MAATKDKWVRRFVITETTRHKRGFTIYKVTSLVFLKTSPERASKVSVWKRYNDFKKLHKSLNNLYKSLNMKETFPPFPGAKFFSRFETEVIKERRESAVQLLEFIGRHRALFKSDVFVKFFETSLQSNPSSDCNQSIGSDTSDESQTESVVLTPQKEFEDLSPSLNTLLKLPPPLNPDPSRSNYESSALPTGKIEEESPKLEDLVDSSGVDNIMNDVTTLEDFGQYILVAAAHMSAGYRHESMNEHDEAFIQYKLGITNLLQGVQIDPDPIRQRRIHEKIKKYSERARTLYNRYLNSNISMLCKSIDELQNYKVIRVMNSVMLVKDLRTNLERVIKTIEKPSNERINIDDYILRGNVPFMVKLHAWVETETTIFLILHYINSRRLWEAIKKRYGVEDRNLLRKKIRMRSVSCDAALQSTCIDYLSDGAGEKIETTDKTLEEELPTKKLLEKAQELLKSVDVTIKRSNSIADRLNKPKCISPTTTDESIASICNDCNDGSESDFSITDSFSESLKKINSSEISNITIAEENNKQKEINSRIVHDNSEDSGIEMEPELWKIPENVVKQWTAQIIVALEFLHRQGVIVKNLKPQNILISENDKVLMCYVIPRRTQEFNMQYKPPYAAPELCYYMSEVRASEAADIWSFGVILYELLTGMNFQTRHAGQFYSHSIITIPSDLSDNAKSLLTNILNFEISERLTLEEIKHHPFYQKIEWETLVDF